MSLSRRPFLTAEWRDLLMVNYEIDPDILQPYVPPGTELDQFQGRTYASLVGFLFLETRLWGLPIPFHQDFEEVNLRFYVRRETPTETRRGVVFVREIVPKRAIAWTARAFYGERYVARPMAHTVDESGVSYRWRHDGAWQQLAARRTGKPYLAPEESEARFITEHYWGYAQKRGGGTREYRVEHPSWRLWPVEDVQVQVDVAKVYGTQFAEPFATQPTSAFLAQGSEIAVLWPTTA